MKLVRLDPQYWPNGSYGHWCPGCQQGHEIDVDRPNSSGAKWSFDGDMDAPTFTPSINLVVNPPGHKHHNPHIPTQRCHYFIRKGMIQFLGDCTHAMKGRNVPLPELPATTYYVSQLKAKAAA